MHAWRDAPTAPAPSAPNLTQAATFLFDDLDEFAQVARDKTGGYLYSRWANPTVAAAMATVSSLEGAEASLGFASGMAAISTSLLAFTRAGDRIVSGAQLYGGTHGLLNVTLPGLGIEATLVDVTDLDAVRAAVDDRTSMLYCETMANPLLRVADLRGWAEIARDAGILFAVDATFTPPVMLRPLEFGVDLVIHSSTKYLGGHADHLGGVVSGSAAHMARIHALVMELGGVMAPMEAFLLHRGMQTLDLRMSRHAENALRLATELSGHPGVERVHYPGLPGHPDHGLASDLLGGRFGGMIAVDLVGGREAGRAVMEKVTLFARAASLGGTKSLIVHPASITHTQLDEAGLRAVGMTEGTLRLSVGIEDVDDLLEDIFEAMR